jgi:DNA topoisomerase-1
MLAEINPGPVPRRFDSEPAGELIHISVAAPGIARRRSGKGFTYTAANGARVADKATLARIRALVIPPAWTDVWISPDPNGHIQAVGFDAKGRKQYRYHARFREQRDCAKFDRLAEFAQALPALRARVAEDMRTHGLGREKVLATIVHLLETTMIRVGNAAYARENKSYGLTTLRNRHVKIDGGALRFDFKGKSGKVWRLNVHDRRVARIVRACQELPGQDLFQYLDDNGHRQAISSGDVNAYLKEVSGRDITAKDYRTWTGTVLAARTLAECDATECATAAKRNLNLAIKQTAARLGNTPTICRKSYIHPAIISAYLEGGLRLEIVEVVTGDLAPGAGALDPAEKAVLAFLSSRCGQDASPGAAAGTVVRGPWPGLPATPRLAAAGPI